MIREIRLKRPLLTKKKHVCHFKAIFPMNKKMSGDISQMSLLCYGARKSLPVIGYVGERSGLEDSLGT